MFYPCALESSALSLIVCKITPTTQLSYYYLQRVEIRHKHHFQKHYSCAVFSFRLAPSSEHVMSGKKKTCFRFIHSSSTLNRDKETKKKKKKTKKQNLKPPLFISKLTSQNYKSTVLQPQQE